MCLVAVAGGVVELHELQRELLRGEMEEYLPTADSATSYRSKNKSTQLSPKKSIPFVLAHNFSALDT